MFKKKEQKISLGQLIPTYDSLSFKPNLIFLIDSFDKVIQCKDCLHEMYIDKIFPDYTLITLKARWYSSEYLSKSNALFTTNISNTKYYVFSGIEDIMQARKRPEKIQKDSSSTKFKIWTLIMNRETITVDTTGYYPFFPPSFLRNKKLL